MSQNFATQQYKKTAFCRPVQTQFIASQTDFTIEKRQKEQQKQQEAGFARTDAIHCASNGAMHRNVKQFQTAQRAQSIAPLQTAI